MKPSLPSCSSLPIAIILAALLLLTGTGWCQASDSAPALPTIAVMPLEAKGIEAKDADVMTDALVFRLQQGGMARVLERTQMNQILNEQGFQKSGVCDGSECAVEMGKLLSVDRIVMGSAGLVGRTYTVNLRMVKVETGEIVASSMQSRAGTIDEALSDLIPISAADITKTFRTEPPPDKVADNEDKKGSSAWIWWTAGGVALAGGAAAAVLLLQDDKSDTPPANESAPTTSLEFQWGN